MRRLELDQLVTIAAAVLGTSEHVVRRQADLNLLDSAANAPHIGHGEHDVYPDLAMKAAVLGSRIMRNHPLPDGNKRLAFLAVRLLVAANGKTWRRFDVAEAVAVFEDCAARTVTEEQLAEWVRRNTDPA